MTTRASGSGRRAPPAGICHGDSPPNCNCASVGAIRDYESIVLILIPILVVVVIATAPIPLQASHISTSPVSDSLPLSHP